MSQIFQFLCAKVAGRFRMPFIFLALAVNLSSGESMIADVLRKAADGDVVVFENVMMKEVSREEMLTAVKWIGDTTKAGHVTTKINSVLFPPQTGTKAEVARFIVLGYIRGGFPPRLSSFQLNKEDDWTVDVFLLGLQKVQLPSPPPPSK